MRVQLFVVFLVVSAAICSHGEEPRSSIAQILTTGGQSIVGQISQEDDSQIKFINIRTGNNQAFSKDEVRSIKRDIPDATATAMVGLPSMMAWRIKQLIPSQQNNGSVVKVDGGIIYVSLGTSHKVNTGRELVVYRGSDELKDPVSGEVLGTQRRKVARLEVVEVVGEKLCKAKAAGDTEAHLEVGDFVTPAVTNKSIVILPLVDASGNETNVGHQVAEELTTTLVNRGLAVVERTLLEKVLGELGVQRSSLVDVKTVQRVGKQIGAYAVLTGTVLAKDPPQGNAYAAMKRTNAKPLGGAEVQTRLIMVETGEILAAASQNMSGVTVKIVHSKLICPSREHAGGTSGTSQPASPPVTVNITNVNASQNLNSSSSSAASSGNKVFIVKWIGGRKGKDHKTAEITASSEEEATDIVKKRDGHAKHISVTPKQE